MAKENQQSTATAAKAVAKKRVVKVDASGEAHINATFNNIIISLTNTAGQVVAWSSAGKMGFRGSKKNTPYDNKYSKKETIYSAKYQKKNSTYSDKYSKKNTKYVEKYYSFVKK